MEHRNDSPVFLVVDLFCGAGGVSTGFDQAKNIYGDKVAYIVAAVNHDPIAIESHWANHPDVYHFNEDITQLYGHVQNGILFMSDHMKQLVRLVDIYRAFYPEAKLIVWSSAECINYSKAKGGQARDADSRSLPEHMDRYIAALDPDYFQVENVVEFMAWGPMAARVSKTPEGNQCCNFKFEEITEDVLDVDEWGEVFTVMVKKKGSKKLVPKQKGTGRFRPVYDAYPVSTKNGLSWMAWKQKICDSFEYREDHRQLNSANYGAYTSRNRLFMIFAKPGLPIVWPEPTHAKKPGKSGMFGDLKKWMPVKDCLDFSDTGQSIFNRDKPLVENTLKRTYAGLVRFVANGDDSFISKYFSGDPNGMNIPTSGPAGTIKTIDSQAVVFIEPFLMQSNGGKPEWKIMPVDSPSRVITSSDNKSLVFLAKYNSTSKDGKVSSGIGLDEPCHTLAVQQRIAVVNAEFLMKYYGSNQVGIPTSGPADVITTKDRFAAIFLDQQYGNSKPAALDEIAATLTANPKLALAFIDRPFTDGGGKHVSIEGPMGSLLTVPKANLVQAEKWVMSTHYDRVGSSLDEPAPVITANRKHHYLMNPQFNNSGSSIENPSFTLIAKMDKKPPYLVTTEEGMPVIVIYPDDSLIMKKIKVFMAVYGIVDIKMRMLKVPELMKIQGFPKTYKLLGTLGDRKKGIGNSVVPEVVRSWTVSLADGIQKLKAAA